MEHNERERQQVPVAPRKSGGVQSIYRATAHRQSHSHHADEQRNSKRLDINAAIQNILADKPYVLPRQSAAERLHEAIHDSGIQTAINTYNNLKNTKSTDYDLEETELNTLGYQLLYAEKRVSDAIAIFKLNTAEHPASSNAFDSLGEAYRQNGERDLAIGSYQTAVKLDPMNGHAAAALKELQSNTTNWISALVIATAAFGLIGLGRKWYQCAETRKL
jgi:tetratricopeptide (TPR) repeat protein